MLLKTLTNLKSEFLDLLVLCFLSHKMFLLNSKDEFLKSYLTKVIKGEKTLKCKMVQLYPPSKRPFLRGCFQECTLNDPIMLSGTEKKQREVRRRKYEQSEMVPALGDRNLE